MIDEQKKKALIKALESLQFEAGLAIWALENEKSETWSGELDCVDIAAEKATEAANWLLASL
jgi:hypothetical protein